MHQPDAPQVRRILIGQVVLTLALTVAALPFGAHVALSALIGAAACLSATAVFAFWVFRRYSARRPDLLVMRFYGAEIVKLALVLGIFAVVFATVEDISLPALLAAYLVVQVLPTVLAPIWGAGSRPER
jgi:ATP synthase protein I